MVTATSGEDTILFTESGSYAAILKKLFLYLLKRFH